MCPSYMVTREEKDSTRGRARMLFEMMNGEIIQDGWKSEAVKDALDLCFSCKGCKGDCPVNVDMATYKAEFLSHYYAGRLRPRHAYAFGWIHIWASLASLAPSLANLFTQTPGLSRIAKLLAGVHPEAEDSGLCPADLSSLVPIASRKIRRGGPPVVLFADTFNNHFHPDVAIAATEVLEDAGFRVEVPMADVCCGRPLYDYGFLGMARRWWLDLLDKLRPYYQAGVPMVVLEPSCWAAFRDELPNMLPNEEDAERLKELTFTLSDFLRTQAAGLRPAEAEAKGASFTAIAIKRRSTRSTTRSSASSSRRRRSSRRWASSSGIRKPAAAAWRARSATRRRAGITRSASPPENGCCCRRSAAPIARRSSSPTGSVARSRSSSRPIA